MRSIISFLMLIVFSVCFLFMNFTEDSQSSTKEKFYRMELGLLKKPIPTFYSNGALDRAVKLQNEIWQMNKFFNNVLEIDVDISLTVLNPDDWAKLTQNPYGLPFEILDEKIIFMPSNSGGFAFNLMLERKEAIPSQILQEFLKNNNQSFEEVADTFVDLIGFHEFGHILLDAYGINPGCHWLNEFAASYFSYSYIAENKNEYKQVFDLLGRPSHKIPKNTTLADFEKLYDVVDDYGWYQGMFEAKIKQIYPEQKIKFLKELKKEFPKDTLFTSDESMKQKISLKVSLERMERITPGFKEWAKTFE